MSDMKIQELSQRREEAARFLQLIANPHRLCILCELGEGERSVSQLERIVEISQSALSQHLAKLRDANIVSTRRQGQSIFYSIADPRSARVIGVLAEIFCKPE